MKRNGVKRNGLRDGLLDKMRLSLDTNLEQLGSTFKDLYAGNIDAILFLSSMMSDDKKRLKHLKGISPSGNDIPRLDV